MNHKTKIRLIVISLMGPFSGLSVSQAGDETILERASHPDRYPSGSPSVTFYKVIYHRKGSNFFPEVIDQEFSKAVEENVDTFIHKGLTTYPLPSDHKTIIDDFKGDEQEAEWTQWLTKALEGDQTSLASIGSLYMRWDQDEKAKPWVFAAADKNDPNALGMLASLVRREKGSPLDVIPLEGLELELLRKAAHYGNTFAEDALKSAGKSENAL